MRTIKIVGRLRGCFASLAMTVCFVAALLAMTTVAWGQTYKPEKNKVEFRNNTRFKVSPYAVPAVADSGLVTKLQLDAAIPDTIQWRSLVKGLAGKIAKFNTDSTFTIAADGVDFYGVKNAQNTFLRNEPKEFSIIRALGGSIITWGFAQGGGGTPVAAGTNLADGALNGALLEPVNRDTTSLGLYYTLGTAGNATFDNTNGFALYEINPSTWTVTKVAETANNSAIWTAAAGSEVYVAWQASVTLYANKYYYLAFLYNSSAQTTAPALRVHPICDASTNNAIIAGGNYRKLGFSIYTQTTFPSTLTFSSGTGAFNSAPICRLVNE